MRSPATSYDFPDLIAAGDSAAACRFCDALEGQDEGLEWTVVDESPTLVAVPSVGLLLPGWLLVVPKAHTLSFGALAGGGLAGALSELQAIAHRWERIFGPLAWFEHGPAHCDSPVGCSIDHAHMHLVPIGGLDLLAGARELFPAIDFREVDGPEAVAAPARASRPYLYLRTPDDRSWLASGEGLPSQAFRRVIAHLQGRPDEYDWRRNPHTAELADTVRRAQHGPLTALA